MDEKVKKKLLYWQAQKTITLLKNSIRKDFISVTTTDTIFGFLANLSEQSFKYLNELKGERSDKPYLILIASPKKLVHFTDPSLLDSNKLKLVETCWPGPVTIIFKAKPQLPKFLTSKDGTIAIRCPKHKWLQNLLEAFDGLFSTSANKTASNAPKNIEEINPEILEKIKYLVTDKKEINNLTVDTESYINQTLPSTIIDLSGRKEVRVIRSGAYPIETLEKIYGSKFKK
jgi:L-threonylcarbamoyladenylate synthase